MTWWCLPSAPTSSHLTPLHLVGQILLPSTCSGRITIGNSCPPNTEQTPNLQPPLLLDMGRNEMTPHLLALVPPSFSVFSIFTALYKFGSPLVGWKEAVLLCLTQFPSFGASSQGFFIPSMACCSRPFVHGSEGPHISLMLAFSTCCTQISKDKSGVLSISLVRGDTLKWTYSQHNHTP